MKGCGTEKQGEILENSRLRYGPMMRAAPIRSRGTDYGGRNVREERKEGEGEKGKNEGRSRGDGMSGEVKKLTETVGQGGCGGGEGVAVGKGKGIEGGRMGGKDSYSRNEERLTLTELNEQLREVMDVTEQLREVTESSSKKGQYGNIVMKEVVELDSGKNKENICPAQQGNKNEIRSDEKERSSPRDISDRLVKNKLVIEETGCSTEEELIRERKKEGERAEERKSEEVSNELESEENENEVRCHYIVELPSEGEMVQYKINEEEVRNKVEIEKGLVPQFRRMELKRPLVIEKEEEERGKRIKMDKMGDEIWYAHEGKEKEEVVRRIEVKIKGVEKQSRKRVNVRRKKEKKGVCIQD